MKRQNQIILTIIISIAWFILTPALGIDLEYGRPRSGVVIILLFFYIWGLAQIWKKRNSIRINDLTESEYNTLKKVINEYETENNIKESYISDSHKKMYNHHSNQIRNKDSENSKPKTRLYNYQIIKEELNSKSEVKSYHLKLEDNNQGIVYYNLKTNKYYFFEYNEIRVFKSFNECAQSLNKFMKKLL